MLLNQYDIEKYVATTAARADLRVEWKDPPVVPSTNGTTIILPKITSFTTEDEAEALISSTIHEVEHVRRTNFGPLKKYASADARDSFLGAIFNIIEDDNIDHQNAKEFYGDAQIRNRQVARLQESIGKHLAKSCDASGHVPKNFEPMASLLTFFSDASSDHYPACYPYSDEYRAMIGDTKYLDKLYAGPYRKELAELRKDESNKRTEKAFHLAQRIFKEVFEQDPEEEEKKAKERAQQRAAADGEGKDGKEGSGSKEGAGTPKDGKGKGKGKSGEYGNAEGGEEAEGSQVYYKPLMMDNHEKFNGEKTSIITGNSIDYSKHEDEDYSTYSPTPMRDTIVVDYAKNKASNPHIDMRAVDNHSGYRAQTNMEYLNRAMKQSSAGFANKVRRLLQIRSKGKNEYGTKRGSLHPSNLYRAVLKNAPGYNERVFKRHITAETLDTSVTVLVDISGSMSGHKVAHAILGAAQLSDAIGNALHIPVDILGFTELGINNAMFVYRTFNDKFLSREKLIDRMLHSTNYMQNNCDGDSVLYGYHRLKQQRSKRKLMIVLSDGSPASGKRGDVYAFTKATVQQIENSKSVDIVGVGIMDDNVKRIYKQHHVISSAEEIEKALLSIIERKVI